MKSFVTMSLYVQLPPLKKTKKIDQTTPGVSHSFKNLYIYGFFFFFTTLDSRQIICALRK